MTMAQHGKDCLNEEALFEIAAGRDPSPSERAHLETCRTCRERVAGVQAIVAPAKAAVNATLDRAVSAFRLQPLPERTRGRDSVRTNCMACSPAMQLPERPRGRNSVWRLLVVPIPAYAVMAAALLMLLPVVLLRPPGSSTLGAYKEVTSGVSSAELFTTLYAPDLRDANQILVTIDLLEQYSAAKPDDTSVHVKLVQLYEALLKLRGWETPSLTRDKAKTRLETERSAGRHELGRLLGSGH